MTSPQQPVHSPFTRDSSASDVLAGIDLHDKVALVTGGYSGLGLALTQALVAAGAHVVVPARRPDVARAALGALATTHDPEVEVAQLDLADLATVHGFGAAWLERGTTLDIVVAAAGIMAAPEERVGDDWEPHFAINHLGHYALINLLWPVIAPGPGRVVSFSSSGHLRSPMRWDDSQFRNGYDKWLAYYQSKTANVLFGVQLNAYAQSHGVRAFSLNPGAIHTPLQRHLPLVELVALGWADAAGNPVAPHLLKNPEQGAATAAWAATSPLLDGLGGLYLEDCEVAVPAAQAPPNPFGAGVADHAVDPEQAQRLWELSATYTGINAFA